MKITLDPVSVDEKEILRNLMEKYDYEFSQTGWTGTGLKKGGIRLSSGWMENWPGS